MSTPRHFHFVGINGIGMSGIAKILYKQGHIISGCDLATSMQNVQELIDGSCPISQHHNSDICRDYSITTVVYSSDVAYNNPELIYARNKGIPTVQRAAMLAEILQHQYAIGIAGSHGKTTTSSMIAHILMYAQTDPTIVVGGIMHNINNNARYGSGFYAVAETDESDRSLLVLPIKLAVLTNIDYEHANIYQNINEIIQVFTEYINKIPHDGAAIVCLDDHNIANILSSINTPTITYGTTSAADIQATQIILNPDTSSFYIYDNRSSKTLGIIHINMPSIYNVLNATAAVAAGLYCSIDFAVIAEALSTFQGVDRRFSYKGTMQSPHALIFDDYGHHPTEIYHSLITARRKTKNKLIVIFQPQRYTRTYHLWQEFIQVFASAEIDHLIITDIYAANEPIIDGINGQELVNQIQQQGSLRVEYIPFTQDLALIEQAVLRTCADDDLILLLGAGKVNQLAAKLL